MENQNRVHQGAMTVVHFAEVPRDANVVGSHVICRIRLDDTVKGKIVPWGDHDVDRYYLRTDLPCMSPEIFRITLSIGAQNGWDIGEMDITAAFL